MPTRMYGRPAYRSELVGGEVVALLRISFAGRDFRWSSRPIDIDTTDGTETYQYDGGLPETVATDALALLTTEPDIRSQGFEVVFPTDVAALVADGHDLASATGELSLFVAGGKHEDRRVLIAGRVVQPEYGADGEPVALSLEEAPWDDATLFPPAGATITTTTWSTARSDAVGRVYPWVFGRPGIFEVGAVGMGTPAYPVEEAVAETADTLLIAGHAVAATSVRVYAFNSATGLGTTSATISVTTQADGLGRTCAIVDVTGQTTGFRQGAEFWVIWDQGAGGLSDSRGGETRGLGDVCYWLLQRSQLRADLGKWAAVRQRLNAWKVDGYFDEQVVPFQWIADNLLPLVPLSLHTGPDGVYPVLWRYDATADEAREAIDADAGEVVRVSRVAYTALPWDLVNEIRLEWALDAQDRSYRRASTITSARDADDPWQLTSHHTEVSATRYGARAGAVVTSDVVYDPATAERTLGWMVQGQGLAHRLISYEVDQSYGWLRLGDIVTITDADLSLSTDVALVHGLDETDTGRWRLELQILSQPASEGRTTGTPVPLDDPPKPPEAQ